MPMATRVVKLKVDHSASLDRISNLPPNITEIILERLPLREAVRTSILSRRWRYKWTSISQLVLDKQVFANLFKKKTRPSDACYAYTNIVNKVLLYQSGLLLKFVLYFPPNLPSGLDISHWIKFLSINGVKDLSIHDDRSLPIKLPSCLFSAFTLEHLSIHNCVLKQLPPEFWRFSVLVSLKLHMPEDHKDGKVIESLISKCPKLEILALTVFQPMRLSIQAPKLHNFSFNGCCLKYLSFKGNKSLRSVRLQTRRQDGDGTTKLSDLIQLLRHISSTIKKLDLSDAFWEIDDINNETSIPEKLPVTLSLLKTLKLGLVSPKKVKGLPIILCFIRSAPYLEQLEITGQPLLYYEQRCYDLKVPMMVEDCNSFCHLQTVKLTKMSGWKIELELIRFLLASCPILKTMLIKLAQYGTYSSSQIAKELMRFPRASTKAEIIYN